MSSMEIFLIFNFQVHYYEDGNVQLVTTKEVKENLKVTVSRRLYLFVICYYEKLDHCFLQFQAFDWLRGHGIWTIVPCSRNSSR